ncbi:MAG: T9SS type A sorting domain-containing protein, partial [Elusimicrobiota bacterium]|nr:T9SS type A sorting domain-containing protein [Elusimicrobiota bacterium]
VCVLKIDADGDGFIDGFVDINGDALADFYWQPNTGLLTPILLDDVDGDGNVDYIFDTDGDGIPWHYYDRTHQKALHFGKVSGIITDVNSNSALSDVTVTFTFDTGTTTVKTDKEGRYNSNLLVMHGKPVKVDITKSKYKPLTLSLNLIQGSLLNFFPLALVPANVVVDKLDIHNYPNPVRVGSDTTFVYNIPTQADTEIIILTDMGEEVYHKSFGVLPNGTYFEPWNLKKTNSNNVSSGLYYVILKSGGEKLIKKVVILEK